MSNTRFRATEWPDFERRKVFFARGPAQVETTVLFARCNATRADDISEADVAVFLGGVDVDPVYYGEKPIDGVTFNTKRDNDELKLFEDCVSRKIPMFGICRGMQVLSVFNGAKLWQHVDNHAGTPHDIVDLQDRVIVNANSFHHQMVRPAKGMTIVATTANPVSSVYRNQNMRLHNKGDEMPCPELEAIAFEDTMCFGVQGHPEWSDINYAVWCMSKLHSYLRKWELRLQIKYQDTLQRAVTAGKEMK